MEETTTSTPVDDAAVDTGQPTTTTDEPTNEQAVETEESSTTSSETETQEAKDDKSTSEESDDDIKAWAKKKGLDYNPDNPTEAKLAKMVYEGDKKVTEAGQKASELGKSVESASSELGLDDVAALRNEVAVMRFYQTYPDARDLDGEMAKTLEEKPYFANDLEGLYFYTKGTQSDKNLVLAKQTGSKEALAATAQAERAATPKTSATNRTSPKELTDADIRNMSTKEYQQAKADGLIDPWGARPE